MSSGKDANEDAIIILAKKPKQTFQRGNEICKSGQTNNLVCSSNEGMQPQQHQEAWTTTKTKVESRRALSSLEEVGTPLSTTRSQYFTPADKSSTCYASGQPTPS